MAEEMRKCGYRYCTMRGDQTGIQIQRRCKDSDETPASGTILLPANSARSLDVCRARRRVLLVRRCGEAARRTTLLLPVQVSKVKEQLEMEELTVFDGKEELERAMVVLLGVVGGVRSWATLEESIGRTPVRRLVKRRTKTPVDSSTGVGSTFVAAISATRAARAAYERWSVDALGNDKDREGLPAWPYARSARHPSCEELR
jgi:hypothetical protein